MIYWKEEYRIGVPLIDEQHIRLFAISDEIYELLKNDMITDKYDKIIALLEELKNYTIFHFNSEENYMKEIGYKKFLSHKVEHDDFMDKINNVDFKSIDSDQDGYIMELLEFLVKWIVDHILERDKAITA